jgi:hypothetical protein
MPWKNLARKEGQESLFPSTLQLCTLNKSPHASASAPARACESNPCSGRGNVRSGGEVYGILKAST